MINDYVFTGLTKNNHLVYGRSTNNEKTKLENKLKQIYNVKYALITTSGMNAISSVFNAIFRNEDAVNIVISDELYEDTLPTLNYIKNGLLSAKDIEKSEIDYIDVSNTKSIINLFEQKYNNKRVILYIESCTNPSGKIFNFNVIKILKNITKNNLLVICDNTWLSGYSLNPFEFDVDIVVESATKYYSAGKTICGVVLSNDKNIMKKIESFTNAYGIHVSPDTSKRVLSMIDDTENRIKISSQNTLLIIEYFKSKIGVNIYHPSIEDQAEHQFAKDNYKYYPSVVYIKFKKSREDFMSWLLNHAKNLKYRTSYGSNENKIDEEPGLDEEGNICCRLAMSYNLDSYKDVIQDFEILFCS